MSKNNRMLLLAVGLITGFITGIFGGGGGMILVPLLSLIPVIDEKEIFASSICIILPVCIVSILLSGSRQPVSLRELLPYLTGSFLGGIAAGIWGRKIPVYWLHRVLGVFVLWGGIRYLCQSTV